MYSVSGQCNLQCSLNIPIIYGVKHSNDPRRRRERGKRSEQGNVIASKLNAPTHRRSTHCRKHSISIRNERSKEKQRFDSSDPVAHVAVLPAATATVNYNIRLLPNASKFYVAIHNRILAYSDRFFFSFSKYSM